MIQRLVPAPDGIGPKFLASILKRYGDGWAPLSETVAIQDIDDLRGFVTRLKDLGSRIAIDDFGAGYTSFRNLLKLAVDIVKIDGAFVQTLIDLARRLKIRTVAEWVQDEAAAAMLSDWDCDYIQGRLIGLASAERPWQKGEHTLPAAG